jgi:hypothetical protein
MQSNQIYLSVQGDAPPYTIDVFDSNGHYVTSIPEGVNEYTYSVNNQGHDHVSFLPKNSEGKYGNAAVVDIYSSFS